MDKRPEKIWTTIQSKLTVKKSCFSLDYPSTPVLYNSLGLGGCEGSEGVREGGGFLNFTEMVSVCMVAFFYITNTTIYTYLHTQYTCVD